jgi:hypothetical protein
MTTDDTPRHSSARGVACTTAVLAGSFLTLLALVAIVAGAVLLWGDSQKDSAGYVSTSAHRFSSGSYALATDRLDAQVDAPGWLVNRDHYGHLRLQVRPQDGRPVFVGIAPTDKVSAYLARVQHDLVTDVSYHPFRVETVPDGGPRRPAAPATQRFWAASAHGPGRQTLTWNVRSGQWSIVVMNADSSRGVAADVSAGARLPWLAPAGWATLGGGLLALVLGGSLVFAGIHGRRDRARPRVSGLEAAPAR